jgi:hypothetical protein
MDKKNLARMSERRVDCTDEEGIDSKDEESLGR